MSNRIFATIDIGTNSVLLLIAHVDAGGAVLTLDQEAIVTGLGKDRDASGNLALASQERTLAALREYKARCDRTNVEHVAVVGTAALRNAPNAAEFLQRAKKRLGFEIEVISGEREAELTYAAAAHDFGKNIVVIDIGGGSTEYIFSPEKMMSLNIGSVWLTEQFLHSDPVTEEECEKLEEFIGGQISTQFQGTDPDENTSGQFRKSGEQLRGLSPKKFVAVAGTATTMATMQLQLDTYDQHRVHGYVVSRSDIKKIIAGLKPLTIEARKKLAGLHPDRADAILAGAILLEQSMQHLRFERVTVSDRGLRWGLFYERFLKMFLDK